MRGVALDGVGYQAIKLSSGQELPGNFNPLIISHIFWEQSKQWNEIAIKHVEKVACVCKTFMHIVLEEVATPDIRQRLTECSVDETLVNSLKEAKKELEKLMADKASHPMTYNHVSCVYCLHLIYGANHPSTLPTRSNAAQV